VARALELVAKLCEWADAGPDSPALVVPEAGGLELVGAALGHFWNHPPVVIPACTVLASLAKAEPVTPPLSWRPSLFSEETRHGWGGCCNSLLRPQCPSPVSYR
jgi:hypothetical protein